ncbi:type VII secretion protein EssB/YukC, partial [Priestia megaterium]|uniref:type VII secretion protein EssB/YukC n=1 Tax=Priestia megaterium TaxID=1404 RepID=UPI0028FC3054
MINHDQLQITINPTSQFQPFTPLTPKQQHQKSLFPHHLIKNLNHHSFSTLHFFISPQNIIFHKTLSPPFLHYGV